MNDQWTPWNLLSASVAVGISTDGWNLAEASDEPRVFVVEVTFSTSFNATPVIQVGLTGFDMDQRDSGRIRLKTTDITPTGFKVEIITWLDTRVYAVEFSWLAIGG